MLFFKYICSTKEIQKQATQNTTMFLLSRIDFSSTRYILFGCFIYVRNVRFYTNKKFLNESNLPTSYPLFVIPEWVSLGIWALTQNFIDNSTRRLRRHTTLAVCKNEMFETIPSVNIFKKSRHI